MAKQRSGIPDWTLIYVRFPSKCSICGCECKGTRAFYKTNGGVRCRDCQKKACPDKPDEKPAPSGVRKPNPKTIQTEYHMYSVQEMKDYVKNKSHVDGAQYYPNYHDWGLEIAKFEKSSPDYERDVMDRMREKIESRVQPPPTQRRKIRLRHDGDELDVDSYLQKADKCWLDVVMESSPRAKTIKILVGNTSNCSRTAETIAPKGALVCVLVEEMERRGVMCEVEIVYSAKRLGVDENRKHRLYVRVKESSQPGSECGMFDAVARVGFMNAYLSAIPSTCPDSGKHGGCGNPDYIQEKPAPCDVWIPDGMMDEDMAVEIVLTALREQGVLGD